jgi:hypothetical protein
MSFVFMMLLAVQYALQPRLSRKHISPKINNQSVALVEEVVKTGMAAAIFFSKPVAEIQSSLKGEKAVCTSGLCGVSSNRSATKNTTFGTFLTRLRQQQQQIYAQ